MLLLITQKTLEQPNSHKEANIDSLYLNNVNFGRKVSKSNTPFVYESF